MKHMCSVPVVMHPFAKIVLCICLKKGTKGVQVVEQQLPNYPGDVRKQHAIATDKKGNFAYQYTEVSSTNILYALCFISLNVLQIFKAT